MNTELKDQLPSIRSRLTPAYVEAEVQVLLHQGQDVGGGVNAVRLVRRWIGKQVFDAVPSLVFFEGD